MGYTSLFGVSFWVSNVLYQRSDSQCPSLRQLEDVVSYKECLERVQVGHIEVLSCRTPEVGWYKEQTGQAQLRRV